MMSHAAFFSSPTQVLDDTDSSQLRQVEVEEQKSPDRGRTSEEEEIYAEALLSRVMEQGMPKPK